MEDATFLIAKIAGTGTFLFSLDILKNFLSEYMPSRTSSHKSHPSHPIRVHNSERYKEKRENNFKNNIRDVKNSPAYDAFHSLHSESGMKRTTSRQPHSYFRAVLLAAAVLSVGPAMSAAPNRRGRNPASFGNSGDLAYPAGNPLSGADRYSAINAAHIGLRTQHVQSHSFRNKRHLPPPANPTSSTLRPMDDVRIVRLEGARIKDSYTLQEVLTILKKACSAPAPSFFDASIQLRDYVSPTPLDPKAKEAILLFAEKLGQLEVMATSFHAAGVTRYFLGRTLSMFSDALNNKPIDQELIDSTIQDMAGIRFIGMRENPKPQQLPKGKLPPIKDVGKIIGRIPDHLQRTFPTSQLTPISKGLPFLSKGINGEVYLHLKTIDNKAQYVEVIPEGNQVTVKVQHQAEAEQQVSLTFDATLGQWQSNENIFTAFREMPESIPKTSRKGLSPIETHPGLYQSGTTKQYYIRVGQTNGKNTYIHVSQDGDGFLSMQNGYLNVNSFEKGVSSRSRFTYDKKAKAWERYENTSSVFNSLPESLKITPQNALAPLRGYPEAYTTINGDTFIRTGNLNGNDQYIPVIQQGKEFTLKIPDNLREQGKSPVSFIFDQKVREWGHYGGMKGGAIVLQTLQDPIVIKLPMDGIIVSPNYKTSVAIGNYSFPVRYDDTIGAWRQYNAETGKFLDRVWLRSISPEKWETGSLKKYMSIKKTLPATVQVKTLEMPRLPKLPKHTRPIPKTIHYVWIGDKALPENMVANIHKNCENSKGYKSILHVDATNQSVMKEIQGQFKGSPLTISDLNTEKFFKTFLSSEDSGLYTHAKAVTRFVSSADVMRLRIINEHGGIYMDVDDTFEKNIANVVMRAAEGDVLLGRIIEQTATDFEGFGNSIFASLPNNPVLNSISKEITAKYNADIAFYDQERPIIKRDELGNVISGSIEEMKKYGQEIFERTGPKVFNKILKQERPDYYDTYKNSLIDPSLTNRIFNNHYNKKLRKVIDHYYPFHEKIPVHCGTARSWETNR
ncbi:glycosyltransferase family 32 protein [Glaciimonas immobilis]|uniref:Uncharacterized protein n=1 Tax=Glaciimonas immobilis TaxID=728004 RepID=A0A840S0T0_9BURK|nr:glycosyltransferase [Glaciimonas immobilis]KAF3996012.1 hypothetical protein HAV38_21145 [Glaciimonas immobilis]MBB5202484.1 hypothetical protein [Glaciimonas immobilis]